LIPHDYAYGIRNSFGFDFDPITGNIWDTENGPGYGDEINLVEPGFNTGWSEVTGMSSNTDDFDPEDDDLVSFDGKGEYSHPNSSGVILLDLLLEVSQFR
jgi:glucose/arabinose dehydrogenase